MKSQSSRGYTVVELMMALAVMAIGLSGVIAMQKVTLSSNGHARKLALATRLAQSWLDELAADSGQWNDTNDFADTDWLLGVGGENTENANWFRPTYSSRRNFGPAFDALGNVVATVDFDDDAHFCTDVRLTWMHGQETFKKGAGLIRAQVRVFWRREGVVALSNEPAKRICSVNPTDFESDDAKRLYHTIYLTTAIRQHLQQE